MTLGIGRALERAVPLHDGARQRALLRAGPARPCAATSAQGGFLHVDDNYGMDASIRRELARLFPDRTLVEVPLDHPIYHLVYRLPAGHSQDPRARRQAGAGVRHLHRRPPGGLLLLSDRPRRRLGRSRRCTRIPPEKREAALRMGVNLFAYAVGFGGSDPHRARPGCRWPGRCALRRNAAWIVPGAWCRAAAARRGSVAGAARRDPHAWRGCRRLDARGDAARRLAAWLARRRVRGSRRRARWPSGWSDSGAWRLGCAALRCSSRAQQGTSDELRRGGRRALGAGGRRRVRRGARHRSTSGIGRASCCVGGGVLLGSGWWHSVLLGPVARGPALLWHPVRAAWRAVVAPVPARGVGRQVDRGASRHVPVTDLWTARGDALAAGAGRGMARHTAHAGRRTAWRRT